MTSTIMGMTPGALGSIGGGITGMGVGSWPMPSFLPGGTRTMDTGKTGLGDSGQVRIHFQRVTVKSDSVAVMSAGVARHNLFFVHRSKNPSNWDQVLAYVACSLPHLNKLLFVDSHTSRGGGKSLYHTPSPNKRDLWTADAIMSTWTFQGACIATEGTDVVTRAMMNKLAITECVGGWAPVYNYWGTLDTDAHLFLLLKVVEIQTDANGNTVNGHFKDTSEEAERRRSEFGLAAANHEALAVDEREELNPPDAAVIKRRRVAMGAAPVHVGDPWLAWQWVPVAYVGPRTGPSPSELRGCIRDENGRVRMRWQGAAVRVGRSGFVGHRGARPELRTVQREAAISVTHPFELSAGVGGVAPGESLLGSAKGTEHIGMIDVYLRM